MKKIHVIEFTLFAVCAFFGVAVSSAFATEVPQWLVEGRTIALGESVNATIAAEGNLLLYEDMNAGAAGDPDILCEVEKALGFLLSNGEGEAVEGECTKPILDKGTCGNLKIEPIHLPWTTLLLEPTTGDYEVVTTGGTGGEPGISFECTVLGVKVVDTCTADTIKTLLANTEDGLVRGEMPEEEEKAEQGNCSIGGKESGLLVGVGFLHALNSKGELLPIAVSLAEEVS